MADTDKEIVQILERIKTGLEDRLDEKLEKGFTERDEAMRKNQKAIDDIIVKSKQFYKDGDRVADNASLASAISVGIKEHLDMGIVKKFESTATADLRFALKSVGTMSSSASLTGDPIVDYSNRQGLVPSQKVNFRDLIPTVFSPDGTYVQYQESGSEGSIDEQTEGSAKSQIDYDFTERKTSTGYTAGFVTITRQLMQNLGFMQNTLPRLLMRDFYKKENFKFWDNIAQNATGYNTTVETDDVKEIIDVLTGRADLDYENSFILCKNATVGSLLKLLYTNGYYAGSGSVVGTPEGRIFIMGVPVVGVSWAAAGKVAIIDRDMIERVESDPLNVQFSYEHANNFTENKVTVRVECREALNLVRASAHSYFTI